VAVVLCCIGVPCRVPVLVAEQAVPQHPHIPHGQRESLPPIRVVKLRLGKGGVATEGRSALRLPSESVIPRLRFTASNSLPFHFDTMLQWTRRDKERGPI
jgi:hypothetical protein